MEVNLILKEIRRMFDYNQPDSIEVFHKFHHISLINKKCWTANDVNQRRKYRKQRWHRTTKFANCYWKMSKRKPQFTRFSSYEFDSFIPGYHVYQHIQIPVEGEMYNCTRESKNEQDCNAVARMYEDSRGPYSFSDI